MENFSIQNCTLRMMIMILMVSAASMYPSQQFSPEELLEQVHEEAIRVSKENLETLVPYKREFGKRCMGQLFCLAEKSLLDLNLTKLDRLRRTLHQYNNKNPTGNCKLDTTEKHKLRILVCDIVECSKNSTK